jgi:hypothetical protein
MPSPAEPRPAPTPARTRQTSRIPLLVGAGGLVLLLAVGGTWALSRGGGDPAPAGPMAVASPTGTGSGVQGGGPAGVDEEAPEESAATPVADPPSVRPAPADAPAPRREEPPPPAPTRTGTEEASDPGPQAAATPPAEAVPVAATPPAAETTEAAPPPEAAPSAEVQQITAIARRLMEAVANQDEAGIRTQYEAFAGSEPWWRFVADSTGDYGRTVRLLPQTQVIPIGNTATVVFSLSIDLIDDEGTVATQRTYPLAMRFERGDAGWWLADLR